MTNLEPYRPEWEELILQAGGWESFDSSAGPVTWEDDISLRHMPERELLEPWQHEVLRNLSALLDDQWLTFRH